jgi:hypothetical protein
MELVAGSAAIISLTVLVCLLVLVLFGIVVGCVWRMRRQSVAQGVTHYEATASEEPFNDGDDEGGIPLEDVSGTPLSATGEVAHDPDAFQAQTQRRLGASAVILGKQSHVRTGATSQDDTPRKGDLEVVSLDQHQDEDVDNK